MARELSRQFQARIVEKTYLALVRGGEGSFSSNQGELRSAIQYTNGYASLDTSGNGKPSLTDWEVVGESVSQFMNCRVVYCLEVAQRIAPLSLLRLKLRTGHKHQLRLHLAHCLKSICISSQLSLFSLLLMKFSIINSAYLG